MTQKIKLKLVVLGDQDCGKSSIVNRYVNNFFVKTSQSTIGVDFLKKTLEIDNNVYELCIWDTSGQEKFSAIVSSYYRNITAVLLVFDLSNYLSFKNITKWLNEVNEYCNNDVIIRLVGNKNDLNKAHYQVLDSEINSFCNELNISYKEVSAKNNTNIDEIFTDILIEIKNKLSSGKLKPNHKNGINIIDTFKIEEPSQIKTGCCTIL